MLRVAELQRRWNFQIVHIYFPCWVQGPDWEMGPRHIRWGWWHPKSCVLRFINDWHSPLFWRQCRGFSSARQEFPQDVSPTFPPGTTAHTQSKVMAKPGHRCAGKGLYPQATAECKGRDEKLCMALDHEAAWSKMWSISLSVKEHSTA